MIRKFLLASSNSEDLVPDPFSGSGTTEVVTKQLSGRWLAYDTNSQYNSLAIKKIESVDRMSIED
ncbi:MAG: hypothetical protein JNN15_08035 [Blastocatellia bacterium]|nr:hypothetical protein [Blastocatellia bacterium]